MPEQEKLLFNIPGCFMKVEFKRYKNDNWKCSVINNNDNKRKLIIQSMEKNIMAKIVEELIQNPNELNKLDFNKSSRILKDKVETMKYISKLNII